MTNPFYNNPNSSNIEIYYANICLVGPTHIQGRHHEFEGGGLSMHWKWGGGGVKTVKKIEFEKGGGCITPPTPSSYGGTAPHIHEFV